MSIVDEHVLRLQGKRIDQAMKNEDWLEAGTALQAVGRDDEASAMFRRAAQTAEQRGDLYRAAVALSRAGSDADGEMYLRAMHQAEDLGEFELALECLSEAVSAGWPSPTQELSEGPPQRRDRLSLDIERTVAPTQARVVHAMTRCLRGLSAGRAPK